MASSKDSDDSMGLSTATRAYWRSIEHDGLNGSDDSEETSSEEVEDSSDCEEWSSGDDVSGDNQGTSSGSDDHGGDDHGGDSGSGDGGSDG